jgi:hypothetical protein
MNFEKLGKQLMISGGISFLLFFIIGFFVNIMDFSAHASIISQIGNFLITLGFGLLAIGAILYDVFKKRLNKEK